MTDGQTSEPAPFTLQFQAVHNPDRTAIVDGDLRLSFREFNMRVNRLASALREVGIGRGDRVAVLLHNRAEWAEVMFAMQKLKSSAVPIGYRLKAPEIEFILNNSEARALILGEEFINVVGPVMPRASHIREGNYIVLGDNVPPAFKRYETLMESGSDAELDADPEEASSTIIYTSGTTGTPKGAYRANQPRNLEMLTDIIMNFGFSMNDVNYVTCPLYHSAPAFFTAIHLVFGATVVIGRHFDPEAFLATVEQEKITTAFVVPTQLNRIANLPEFVKQRHDVSSMRALITGAAPCHHSVKTQTIAIFGPDCLYEFYGATETGINTILLPQDQIRKPGSCGKSLVGNDIKIVGEDGKEVPAGEVGQLYVKNSMLITGYYKNEKATEESLLEGYFSVGDMARVDEEGFYYIVDRKKDMVISGGVNIYPAEVENVLRMHPAVYDCVVVGVPDEEWGESLKALVVLKVESEAPSEALSDFCKERLADYKVPRSFDFIDEIPHNPSGKPLKRELRSRYWAGVERKI
ncbi:MAG: AMP-binding protein [Deltaproteobacteria bacterium]|nr:AMP-binding protein [Deltaproteobacteria bacterium]